MPSQTRTTLQPIATPVEPVSVQGALLQVSELPFLVLDVLTSSAGQLEAALQTAQLVNLPVIVLGHLPRGMTAADCQSPLLHSDCGLAGCLAHHLFSGYVSTCPCAIAPAQPQSHQRLKVYPGCHWQPRAYATFEWTDPWTSSNLSPPWV